MKGKKRGPTRRLETTGCGGRSVALPRGASLNRIDRLAQRARTRARASNQKKTEKTR